MNGFEDNKCVDQTRRNLIPALAAIAGMGLPLAFAAEANAEEAKVQLMFVQVSEGLKVDESAKTMRLVNASPHTLYFSDRPERIAGHIKMAAYLEEWTSKAGKDNFGKDPPNATLSVYEPGQPNNTVAVIEITDPKVDGHDLVYGYKIIEGKLPASGEETVLFIDWIGAGGGVGVGFHGVGVGLRGPGRL
ncbi:hypothetical protein [Mesorhizobium sp. LjNodule214]|uniref:hypothetical protein n=1 Tax=Mesorhizobium sp. LjNodule214 TaxID=3342252 RepID=UPI003ECEBF40